MLPTRSEQLESCGEGYITELSQHYSVDACTALQEWASLRLITQEQYSGEDTTAVLRVLAMNDTFQTLCPLLSKFAQIALALPVSNTQTQKGGLAA